MELKIIFLSYFYRYRPSLRIRACVGYRWTHLRFGFLHNCVKATGGTIGIFVLFLIFVIRFYSLKYYQNPKTFRSRELPSAVRAIEAEKVGQGPR